MKTFEHLKTWIKDKLNSPTVFFDAQANDVLSGPALWRRAHDRRHDLRRKGYQTGDIYFCHQPISFEFLVDFVACLLGHYRFFPIQEISKADQIRSQELTKIDPNIVVLLMTGGSVQRKIVGLSEQLIMHQVSSHADYLSAHQGDVRLCLTPWSHGFGFILDLLLGIHAQQTIILFPNPHPTKLMTALFDYDVKHLACVPRILDVMRARHLQMSGEVLSKLKDMQIHYGGAVLSKATRAWCQNTFGKVIEGYGLTEAGPGVLMDGIPLGCEVELRPSSFSNLKEVWVKPQYNSEWFDKSLCPKGFFNTSDLAVFENGRIQITGRNSDHFKTVSGLWKSRFEFNQEIQRMFQCDLADYNPAMKVLKVFTSTPTSLNSSFLRSFIDKTLGSEVQIEMVPLNEQIWNSILNSKKKSIEATFEG